MDDILGKWFLRPQVCTVGPLVMRSLQIGVWWRAGTQVPHRSRAVRLITHYLMIPSEAAEPPFNG